MREIRHSDGRALWLVLGAILALAAVVTVAGCIAQGPQLSKTDRARLRLETPGSVWWIGEGRYAVLQLLGEDGRPAVMTWERASGKTRTFAHFRVVDAEPHAPRIWVVPDDVPAPLGVNPDSAKPRILDIAGDGVDSRPSELYVVDLKKGAKPRSDLDARWAPWDGGTGYSASVEIDVNKGACPSTLRFYVTGGSKNAWSAKVPTDVVSFEPIGWSASGEYFAVITQADESATVSAADAWVATDEPAKKGSYASVAGSAQLAGPPTTPADILVFSAADGALAMRQRVTVPILTPNAGSNLAVWLPNDVLAYLDWIDGPTYGAVKPGVAIDMKDPFAGLEKHPRVAWLLGAGDGRPIFAFLDGGEGSSGPTRMWRIGSGGEVVRFGSAPGASAVRWSEDGGTLSLEGYSFEEQGWAVHLAAPGKAASKLIFAAGGPIEPVRND